MVRFIVRMIIRNGKDKLLSVKRSAQDDYNDSIHAALAESVWASGCKSWYISESGRITTLYPKNATAFKRQPATVNYDDFQMIEASHDNKAA